MHVSVEIVFFVCLHLKWPILSFALGERNVAFTKNTMLKPVGVAFWQVFFLSSIFDLLLTFLRHTT